MKEVVIPGGARTPIDNFGGVLKDVTAHKLGELAVREVISRRRRSTSHRRSDHRLSRAYERCVQRRLCDRAHGRTPCTHTGLFCMAQAEPVKLVGNHEQRQRLLPRLTKGEISGFALTEKDAGYDALINVIWEGSNGILTLWIGRKSLAEYFMHGKAFLEFQITEMLRATPFFVKNTARSFNALSVCEKDGGDAGTFDAVWEHFVARKSRELAQTTLCVAARHRPGLARKQLLMTRLVKAGLHLFAVETPLWYKSQKENSGTPSMSTASSHTSARESKRSSIPSHCSPSGHRRGMTTPTCIARRKPSFPEKPTGWKKASFAVPRWRMARRPGKRVWYALPQNSEGPVRG